VFSSRAGTEISPLNFFCRSSDLTYVVHARRRRGGEIRSGAPGGDRGYRPAAGPDAGAATVTWRVAAERAAHRLLLEVDRLREAGTTSMQGWRERSPNVEYLLRRVAGSGHTQP
jgi:hypothetical protein